MAVDKNSKAYQSLLDKGYTDEQINQMSSSVSGGQSAKDVVASTQPTNTTVTYWGKSNVTPTNVISQQSQNANYNNAKVNTGAVASMPEQPKTTTSGINIDNVAKAWNNMDYATQQDRLNKISGLKEALAKNGITIKEAPEQTTTQTAAQATTTKTTTPTKTTTAAKTTPQQDRWDYQDNSQARMNEIANNLNGYRQTNPGLFEDMSAFYNFFIKDKGRSQDQIDFLWDYFNRVQKFGKYDNLPASTIGDMLVNGKLGDDYLNYLKSIDPQKYQEALSYRQDGEDTIKYESYLSDIAEQAGLSGFEKFYKETFGYEDKNGDKIDDSLYISPTEEEQKDVDRINEINARRMEIKNMQKNLLDDLVEQYPGVPKATLMGIVQDRTKDISREYDDLGVELVQLQGSVEYMQNERDAQSKARQSTINNLEKAYGMYYDYTPEGMAEYAQSKYAAENITLDQADQGTEAQKQMALESVLDGYYDKYGDIIQRSEQQVINDVIAYAKQKGIGLAQALQENFVTPLKSKPEFAALSTGRSISDGTSDKWSVTTVKNANGEDISVMYNQATGEIRNLGGGDYTGGNISAIGSEAKTGYGKSYTVVSTEQLVGGLGDFLDGYEVGDKGGQCGAFVNNGLKKAGVITENIYDNSKESKLKSKNEDANTTAQTGWVAIRNPEKLSGNGAKYGHVGFVVQDNGDGTVKVVDSNGTKNANGEYDETVGVRDVPKSSLYGYFNPTKTNQASKVDYAKVLGWIPTQLRNTDVEKQWYLDIAQEQFEKGLTPFEAAMSIIGFDITNSSEKAQDIKNKVLDIIMKQGSDTLFNQSVLSSMASFINKGDYEGALETLENQLGVYMEGKGNNGLYLDNVSTAVKAIDQLNAINDYKSRLKGGIANMKQAMDAEGKDTSKFYTWTSNIKSTMRALGYDDEDIENMIPKITYSKEEFEEKVSNLEEAILGRYNQIRKNHGMPTINSSTILNKGNLSDLYKIGYVKVEPYTGMGARNLNLRYGLTAEKEAFNSI